MPTDEVKSYLEEIEDDVKMSENPTRPIDVTLEKKVNQELSIDTSLESMGEFSHENTEQYDKILKSLPENTRHDAVIGSDAHAISQHIDAQSRVSQLVALAQTKGVAHAVKVARHLHDNYELDMLHAKLSADEVRNALEAQGLLKNE